MNRTEYFYFLLGDLTDAPARIGGKHGAGSHGSAPFHPTLVDRAPKCVEVAKHNFRGVDVGDSSLRRSAGLPETSGEKARGLRELATLSFRNSQPSTACLRGHYFSRDTIAQSSDLPTTTNLSAWRNVKTQPGQKLVHTNRWSSDARRLHRAGSNPAALTNFAVTDREWLPGERNTTSRLARICGVVGYGASGDGCPTNFAGSGVERFPWNAGCPNRRHAAPMNTDAVWLYGCVSETASRSSDRPASNHFTRTTRTSAIRQPAKKRVEVVAVSKLTLPPM